jgi:uncharacterized protein YuzE
MIKIEYDKEADAVYVYLKEIGPAGVGSTYSCNPAEVKGMINLDFDKDERLIGIEIMDASKKLSKEILDSAEIIG